ncbi:MAG: radical SAM protein [Desulfobacteraceae bacterium]|nr:radical SAM protein [Desulfobacteraceae bacterium]
MVKAVCKLLEQGFSPGRCIIRDDGRSVPACKAALKNDHSGLKRRITSIHLSRPENYLSIYQSGCNFSCKKCHSWYFSKKIDGHWYTPHDILKKAILYEHSVTVTEPLEKTTAWHAHDTCRCCGSCINTGKRSSRCPNILEPEAIVVSPQGLGPARNIVAFTGGDLTCCPEFYGECARLIKKFTDLSVLIETNGYGLTKDNLDYLKTSGVDAFWLDIKAFDAKKHKWLTGCSNENILKLPQQILNHGFVLEVLSLYIPDLIEIDELEKIAKLLAAVDTDICFTILAFFPEYEMQSFKSPSAEDMVRAYQAVKSAGLKNVRLGNTGVFAPTDKDQAYLMDHVDPDAF